MKPILVFLLIFNFMNAAYATQYTLDCQSEVDQFQVMIDDEDHSLIFTEKHSFDINVDDYKYDAEISPNVAIVYADVTTYDYFINAYVRFYLGKGLKNTSSGTKMDIALDADDGDGFGFDKRGYSCLVSY